MALTLNGTTGITNPDGTAATPSVVGSDSNTGVFFPAEDTLGFSTNGVERLRIASNGSQSSVIPSGSTLYPQFGARAWVNFNGTGTIAIVASGNVTSLTDNGVGDYSINFTTAMPDANYAVTGSATDNTNASANLMIIYSATSGGSGPSTTFVRISIVNTNSGAIDVSLVTAMVVR